MKNGSLKRYICIVLFFRFSFRAIYSTFDLHSLKYVVYNVP